MDKDKSILEFFSHNHIFSEEEQKFFTKCLSIFSADDVELIRKSFIAARDLHSGQLRASGEEYITHPLRVASILIDELNLTDVNSVSAALLHDTIEDTGITKEDLSNWFNKDIAGLVDGVSKTSTIKFASKEEGDKINNGLMLRKMIGDFRIILIKLADRLHNIRTLEYKNDPNKRAYKARETLDFYVPLAMQIGTLGVKRELEDLSFKNLYPSLYKTAVSIRKDYETKYVNYIEELKNKINEMFVNNKIDAEIFMKTLNPYQFYTSLARTHKVSQIPSLFTFEVIVNDMKDVYKVKDLLRNNFIVRNYLDYINAPKPNNYRSLYLTVLGFKKQEVNFEVVTHDMHLINECGYAGLLKLHKYENFLEVEKLVNETDFMKGLKEIALVHKKNNELFAKVNEKLLVEYIKVFTPDKKVIWLPLNSTIKDYAYKVHTDIGDTAVGALVNGIKCNINEVLHDGDIVYVVTSDKDKVFSRVLRKD